MKHVPIVYFSDVLCFWAYLAQLRIDEIRANHGDQVEFQPRFCSVFGDTVHKIPAAWGAKGGYAGFNAHLLEAAKGFPEITLNPAIWMTVRPASSMAPHLVLKAIQLATLDGDIAVGVFETAMFDVRRAFFSDGRDISDQAVLDQIMADAGADMTIVARVMASGRAHAALSSDYKDADTMGVQGSPTFILNEGRQKLFGNVGYRILDANIRELLRAPGTGQASWC
jgi:predicted DsbA family dithiol-disulfide isomerase